MKIAATTSTAVLGFSILSKVHTRGNITNCFYEKNSLKPSFSYDFGNGNIYDIPCSDSCSCNGSGTGYTGCHLCCCGHVHKKTIRDKDSNNDWIGTTIFGVFFFALLLAVIGYAVYCYRNRRKQRDPEIGGGIHLDGYQHGGHIDSKIHYTFLRENDEVGINGQNQLGNQQILINNNKNRYARSFSVP